MYKPNWRQVAMVRVPANPRGLWTLAYDYVTGPKKIRITVHDKPANPEHPDGRKEPQQWVYEANPERKCSADGDSASTLDSNKCLCPSALVGALIGKIGGSTTDRPAAAIPGVMPIADKNIVFGIGTFCVLDLKEENRGPLYLTINDMTAGFGDNKGTLEVEICEAL